ncbi:FecR family protein [Devosia alba]|uniref:FecR family protein n=1 Tax=Devosia alba TaxID=3152360 RepID=UPI0032636AC7
MTETPREEDLLWEEALDLVIRLQGDPTNPITADLIRAWRSRSPHHEAAWQEARDIHSMTGHILLGRQRVSRQAQARQLTRRALLAGGTIGLAGIVAGLTFGPSLMLQARADFMTATADIIRFPLEDGSVATLGPESAISIDYSTQARSIELLTGMAFFDVAGDANRPFSVRSGATTATALGTAFDVVMAAGVTTISVDHGRVGIAAGAGVPSHDFETLQSGQWLSLDLAGGTVGKGQRDTGQIAAWRDNLLVVERGTVSVIVEQINRWQAGAILIADPGLGALEISGVFDMRDPLGAIEAVVHPYGGKVRQISPWMTVISII